MASVKKQKIWDRAYYLKKKLRVLKVKLAAVATAAVAPASIAVVAATAVAATAADPATAVASSAAAAASAGAAAGYPWPVNTDKNMRTPAAQKMMKHQHVKPVVDHILHTGSVQAQAVVLCAVADHPSLAPARKVARIDLLKMQAAYK
jgi:hypothetical protein